MHFAIFSLWYSRLLSFAAIFFVVIFGAASAKADAGVDSVLAKPILTGIIKPIVADSSRSVTGAMIIRDAHQIVQDPPLMPPFRKSGLDTLGRPISSESRLPQSLRHQPQIDWGRFWIADGVLASSIILLHIYQLNAWWANQRTTFHVIDDVDYKANFDKFGHTFGAYYAAHFFGEAFNWSGFDSTQSDVLGATCGALWELYIEIEDGFARDWGFSRGDALSDLTGASFYLLRNRIPFMRNFEYKWTYFPSQQLLQNRPDIPGQTLNFIEDYGGQSYWLTMNVHGVLPDALKPYWPEWLNLAGGVAGWNLDATTNGQNDFSKRQKAWYIGLDYDIGQLIPESSIGILNFIRRGLDYWHFPAPAFRISPDPRFFILFPFRMSIG